MCESYEVGFICSEYDPQTVLTAAIMTLGVTIALTLYAFTTKGDFTMYGGLLFVAGFILLMVGFMMKFTNNSYLNLAYSVFGVILYSIYLIYDTQLIAGGKKYQLSLDDYIIGALMLYLDIILLFLKILEILNHNKD